MTYFRALQSAWWHSGRASRLQDSGDHGGVGDLAVDQHPQDAQGVGGLLEQEAAAVEVGGQERAEAGDVEERLARAGAC
jgi:hypothetical protein